MNRISVSCLISILFSFFVFVCSAMANDQGEIHFPTHLDKPKKIFIALNFYNYHAALDLINVLEVVNSKSKSPIELVTVGSDPSNLEIFTNIDKYDTSELPQVPYRRIEDLVKEIDDLAKKTPYKHVEKVQNNDDWMQDFFEFYYAFQNGNWMLGKVQFRSLFQSVRESTVPLLVPDHISDDEFEAWIAEREAEGKELETAAVNKFETAAFGEDLPTIYSSSSYEQGGNFEPYPENIVVRGFMSDGIPEKDFLMGTKYKSRVIEIETRWLNIMHVDEVFSYVPAPADKCGFKVVVPDPLSGWDAVKGINDPDYITNTFPIGEFGFIGGREVLPTSSFYNMVRYNQDMSSGKDPSPEDKEKFERLRDSQTYAQSWISKNLEQLRSGFKKLSAKCPGDFDVIKLPTLFVCSNAKDGVCKTVVPNPVNLVSLGDRVLVAKQYISELDEGVRSAFNGTASVNFINANVYHASEGAVHCATNIVREAPIKDKE